MRLAYQLGVEAYSALLHLAAPLHPKARLWVNGRANTSALLNKLAEFEGAIWMHCASVGEFEQGKPVLEALRKRYPSKKAVVSFFSPSGYEARKDWNGADFVFYLPVDRSSTAKSLVQHLKPSAVIWVKYEFWFNILAALNLNNTPLFLVSGIFRPSQHFFRFWGGWFRKQLKSFSHCFVQDEQSRLLLSSVGVDASVVGDTRFDRVAELAAEPFADPIVEAFAKLSPVLVCGSTWPADEDCIHDATYNSTWRLMLVPHELTNAHLEKAELLFPDAVRYSRTNPEDAAKANVLIVDRMGMLSKLYRFAHVAYIGGGFGAGIHNTAEAAAYGIPVVFGPRFQKFNEAKQLIASGGGFTVNNPNELRELLSRMTDDPALRAASGREAKNLIEQGRGATAAITSAIAEHLEAQKRAANGSPL